MTAALILLLVIAGGGALLYLHDRLTRRPADGATPAQAAAPAAAEPEQCCGMHITCEKDSLVAGMDAEIIYYEDEELDRFAGRGADEYDEAETEEFRDVLLTLRPDEIAGWARSITSRGIRLPDEVREELLMIVSEARRNVTVDNGK